ncbi:MAG: hypothetical protein ABIH35_02235 [Patescibacteria group bacterium]
MPSARINRDLCDQLYFLTFTVKKWYYLFDRHNRFEILEDSFVYCQRYKGLKIYAYVFMLNHIHFIAAAPNLGDVVRDMKAFLSRELQKNIIATEPGILKLFKEKDHYHIWQKTNAPKVIKTEEFFQQKMEYIHFNPVYKQYVHDPRDWRWSSVSKIPGKIRISPAG